MTENIYLTTTITTISATLVYAIVKYFLGQNLELRDIVIFAVVFGIIFFLGQRYFSKKVKKK